MGDKKVRKMVFTALFAALSCTATLVIHIPTPMNGYVNLGDCIVLLSGWLLGPVYGFLAAGIGSGLADFLLGYTYYVPATFVIKGLMALLAWWIGQKLGKQTRPGRLLSAVVAECWMILGYFVYESLLLGYGLAAAASIPGNAIQGLCGLVVATLLQELFERSGLRAKA